MRPVEIQVERARIVVQLAVSAVPRGHEEHVEGLLDTGLRRGRTAPSGQLPSSHRLERPYAGKLVSLRSLGVVEVPTQLQVHPDIGCRAQKSR